MSQHVATGWRNARNMLRPTMLWYVASKCCDRLAGACKNDRNISAQHFATFQRNTYRNVVGRYMLSAFGHPVGTCCEVLRHAGCCWLKFKTGQIFMQHLWMLHDVVVVWLGSCNNVAPRHVHLFNFQFSRCRNMSQQGSQTRATCCAQQCCDMLRSNVVIVWPELANASPTMLGCVELKSYNRLAGA